MLTYSPYFTCTLITPNTAIVSAVYVWSTTALLFNFIWGRHFCHVSCEIRDTAEAVSTSIRRLCPFISTVTVMGLLGGESCYRKPTRSWCFQCLTVECPTCYGQAAGSCHLHRSCPGQSTEIHSSRLATRSEGRAETIQQPSEGAIHGGRSWICWKKVE